MADVRDNAERSRYEVTVDGTLAGIAHYVATDAGRVFDHTKIEPAFEGKGIGSLLVRGALDDVIERAIPFAATCPFVASYLERHPEYAAKADGSLV
jgi:uncharacterized protein